MDILQVLEGATYAAFIVGAIVAVYELRSIKKDRWIGFMLEIAGHASTPEFEGAMCKVYRSTAVDAKGLEEQVSYPELQMVGDYFEAVAYLVTQGHIEKAPILEYVPFEDVWKKIAPWVIAQRKEQDSPEMFDDIERLAEMQSKMQSE